MRYSDFTPSHEKAFIELTQNGAAAVLIYSQNIICNGSLCKYDKNDRTVRTTAVNGEIFVPLKLFTEICGIEYKNGKLSHNGITAIPKIRSISGCASVPIISTAESLGFAAKTYYHNRLAVMGTHEHIAALDNDPALVHAGAYAILGEYDAASVDKSEYRRAKDNWRMKLVGTPEINDMSNPIVAEKISYIEKRCENALSLLNRNEDAIILFGTKPPEASADVTSQYHFINDLAHGWAASGSRYRHNKELLHDILFALEWMYKHMYGQAEIDGTGWRSMKIYNWWDWYIGGPEHLTDVLLLLEDEISREEIKKYLSCFEYVSTFMRHNENPGEAMSRICICTKVGLVLEDPKYLNHEYKDFDMLLELNRTGNGPHIDYVDFTHGMPYNMAYGRLNLDRVLLVASILTGTELEYTSPQMYNQFMLAKYMFEPALYHGQGFMMFCGRSTFAIEQNTGASVMLNLLPMIGVFGEEEDRQIKQLIKHHTQKSEVRKRLTDQCSLKDLSVYEKLMNDASIPDTYNYEYAHAWYTGDRAAQQRNNYAVGIAMSSRREQSYESINSCNKTGWYTGEGAVYLYTTYDDHPYDGKNWIDNINIAYRYPGTTEDMRERTVRSITNGEAWHMPTDFAGSVQFEDKYITAVQDFVSYNFEGPEKDMPDTGYGGGLAIHINDLKAKKAWFCFDKTITALGAGITSTMDSPVNTTLEHRRIVKDEEYSQRIKYCGQVKTFEKSPHEGEYPKTEWINIDGHTGIFLHEKASIHAARYNCEACNNQPYMEFRIEHGKNPKNASYAYTYIPYSADEWLESFAADPDVEIISNTTTIQAVKDKTVGVTGYVFHEAAVCGDIATDTPCIIMESIKGSVRTVRFSDPTHKAVKASVKINGKYCCKEKDKNINIIYGNDFTVMEYDLEDSLGRPFDVVLNRI